MSKSGRPRGASFESQTSILTILSDYKEGLNLKKIIDLASFLDRKTVINTLKYLCEKGVIEKVKVGRYRIYKVIDRSYYFRLRRKRAFKETKPLRIGKRIEDRLRKHGIELKEVLDRLLKEEYAKQIRNGRGFDLALRRVMSEIIEEHKRKRIIDLGD